MVCQRSLRCRVFARYTSPDSDHPAQGVLAATAVRMLGPYVANHVFNTEGSMKASP